MKVIRSFNLDLSDIAVGGETRQFSVIGDNGAVFSLEIKNEDPKYYNFQTNEFQTAKTRLTNEIITGGRYNGSITFPKVSDNDQYDIYLFAETHYNTKHADYIEARFGDNSIDLNSSIGSNSNVLQKVVYQYTNVTITMSNYSPNGTFTLTNTNDTITASRGKNVIKIPFTTVATVAVDKALTINRTPTINDVMAFVTLEVGSAPEDIPGEDIYPAVSDTDTVDGAVASGVKVVMDNNVADNIVVGDRITGSVATDTVDGAVTSGIKVVMDNNVATKMAVGDRITGNSALDAKLVTVAALNPDTDNVKEFSMSEAIAISDGITLTFTPELNRNTVTAAALNPDGDNVKEFSMSEAMALRDGMTLSFSNRMNYRWPFDNIRDLSKGLIVRGTNITTGSTIEDYIQTLTTSLASIDEKTIELYRVDALDSVGQKPTVVAGLVTVQPGNVCFNNQQALALASDALKIYGYGADNIKSMTGYDIELTDLKVELTEVTTTTTSAVSASTSVPVTSRNGILDDISVVSGIGIDPGAVNPTVDTGAGAVSGSGTLVLTAAQTLESGITLTFSGASRIATMTGNIKINKVGISDVTLRFDVEQYLTVT